MNNPYSYNNRQILFFLSLFFFTGSFLFLKPNLLKSQDISFEVEAGGLWFSQNDVRIPNNGGTDFDMLELIGRDAIPYYRLRLNLTYGERHTIRALFAPISKIGTGVFNDDIFFEETTFEGDVPVDGIYRFNTYRFTYRYTFYNRNNWTFGAGAAGLIRDAKVELTQPDRSDSNSDLGFVPLIHIYAERYFGSAVSLVLDGETLASPQGRATDASLTLNFHLSDNWSLDAGYRVLEGGADVDEVYNFAWINFARIGAKIHFR